MIEWKLLDRTVESSSKVANGKPGCRRAAEKEERNLTSKIALGQSDRSIFPLAYQEALAYQEDLAGYFACPLPSGAFLSRSKISLAIMAAIL